MNKKIDNLEDGPKDKGLRPTRITPETWAEVKISYIRDGLMPVKLSEMFGIRQTTLNRVIFRKGWKKEREAFGKILRGVEPGLESSEGIKKNIEGMHNLTITGKKEVIDDMVGIGKAVLKKLQLRVSTLKSNDDKELKWVTENTVKLFDMMKEVLGIWKGEGDTGKVRDDKIQVHILSDVVAQVDELKIKQADEALKEGVKEG